LPLLDPYISKHTQKRLENLGVNLMLGQKVLSATSDKLILESGELKVDAIIWTAGNRNNHLFRSHEHIFEFARNTRVIVNEYLEAADDIYVIGDSADTKYSGMAQTALMDAGFVAKDIINKHNHKPRTPYVPKTPIYVVPVGHRYAVMQSKHIKLYGYPAWILRRVADFKVFSYFEPVEDALRSFRKGNQSAEGY